MEYMLAESSNREVAAAEAAVVLVMVRWPNKIREQERKKNDVFS